MKKQGFLRGFKIPLDLTVVTTALYANDIEVHAFIIYGSVRNSIEVGHIPISFRNFV